MKPKTRARMEIKKIRSMVRATKIYMQYVRCASFEDAKARVRIIKKLGLKDNTYYLAEKENYMNDNQLKDKVIELINKFDVNTVNAGHYETFGPAVGTIYISQDNHLVGNDLVIEQTRNTMRFMFKGEKIGWFSKDDKNYDAIESFIRSIKNDKTNKLKNEFLGK